MDAYRIVKSKVDRNLTQKLKKLKPKARSMGDFTGGVLQAAFYARKTGETYYLYSGNNWGNEVWRVSYRKSDYLNGVNNPYGKLLSVTPDMVVTEHTLKRIKKEAAAWKSPAINKSLAQKVNKAVKKHFVTDLLNDLITKKKDWRIGLRSAIGKAVAPTQMQDRIDAQAPIKKWLKSISDRDLEKVRDWVEEIQNKGKSVQYKTKPEAWKRASTKEAGGLSSALDLLFSIIGQGSSSKGEKMFKDTKKALKTDEQSKQMMTGVIRKVAMSLILDQKENTALNYIIMAMRNVKADGAARNSIFKAANILGMKLPSSMFASEDSELREQLVKLANDNPDMRKHLIPILKETNTKKASAYIIDDLKKLFSDGVKSGVKEVTKFSGPTQQHHQDRLAKGAEQGSLDYISGIQRDLKVIERGIKSNHQIPKMASISLTSGLQGLYWVAGELVGYESVEAFKKKD